MPIVFTIKSIEIFPIIDFCGFWELRLLSLCGSELFNEEGNIYFKRKLKLISEFLDDLDYYDHKKGRYKDNINPHLARITFCNYDFAWDIRNVIELRRRYFMSSDKRYKKRSKFRCCLICNRANKLAREKVNNLSEYRIDRQLRNYLNDHTASDYERDSNQKKSLLVHIYTKKLIHKLDCRSFTIYPNLEEGNAYIIPYCSNQNIHFQEFVSIFPKYSKLRKGYCLQCIKGQLSNACHECDKDRLPGTVYACTHGLHFKNGSGKNFKIKCRYL